MTLRSTSFSLAVKRTSYSPPATGIVPVILTLLTSDMSLNPLLVRTLYLIVFPPKIPDSLSLTSEGTVMTTFVLAPGPSLHTSSAEVASVSTVVLA